MAIEGTKISALKPIDVKDVSKVYVLGYLDGTPKENYKISYNAIKEKVAEEIVDQNYNETSSKAQSGRAVAQAIKDFAATLDERYASQSDIERLDGELEDINAAIDSKADKSDIEGITADIDAINGEIERIDNALEDHQLQIDDRATKDELAKTKDEVEAEVQQAYNDLLEALNLKEGQLIDALDEKVSKLEFNSTTDNIYLVIEELRTQIANGTIGGVGGVDADEVNRLIEIILTNRDYDNRLNVLESNIDNVINDVNVKLALVDNISNALDEKATYEYVDAEIQNILDQIGDLENQEIEYDSYVSATGDNAVTSQGIYNFVTGQGFLTQADVESFKPVEPEIINLPEGDTEKTAYWFTISPEYFGKGYLTGLRLKTGIQPEVEQEEPEQPEPTEPEEPETGEDGEDEDGDGDNDYGDGGYDYDYTPTRYVTLTANKVVRGEDGLVKEFIPLGYSNSYVELADNTWLNFEFDDITISGEDEIAFVFCESTYDEGVDKVDGKVLSVVLATSESESAVIYGEDGEEKALVYGEIEYNAPKEVTGLNIIDTIYEYDYPNWDDIYNTETEYYPEDEDGDAEGDGEDEGEEGEEGEEEEPEEGDDEEGDEGDENPDDGEDGDGGYVDDTYVGLPRVASPVAVMRYVKEKLDSLLESGGIEIGPEQLDYISQQVTYSIGAEISAINTKVDRFQDDIDYLLDGTFLTEKLDDIIYEVKDAISDSLTDTERAVNKLVDETIPSILQKLEENGNTLEVLDGNIVEARDNIEALTQRVDKLEEDAGNVEETPSVGFPDYGNGVIVMDLNNYTSDVTEGNPEQEEQPEDEEDEEEDENEEPVEGEGEEDDDEDDTFTGEIIQDDIVEGMESWEADENCWVLISVTGNGNTASVSIFNKEIISESTNKASKQLFLPVSRGTIIDGVCGYFTDNSANVRITKYPILS